MYRGKVFYTLSSLFRLGYPPLFIAKDGAAKTAHLASFFTGHKTIDFPYLSMYIVGVRR
jgi:hypothetical protein